MLRLQPSSDEEVVQWVTEDSTAIQLSCQITGVGRVLPTVFFLKNGVRITSNGSPSDNGVYIIETSSLSHRILVVESRRGNEGVFQCVGQVGEDGSTTLTTSTYINMQCEFYSLLKTQSMAKVALYHSLMCMKMGRLFHVQIWMSLS